MRQSWRLESPVVQSGSIEAIGTSSIGNVSLLSSLLANVRRLFIRAKLSQRYANTRRAYSSEISKAKRRSFTESCESIETIPAVSRLYKSSQRNSTGTIGTSPR